MAFRIFLDAQVLLDFTLKRESYEISRKLIELAVKGKLQAFITPDIMQTTGYWLTKAYGSAKAKELLLALLTEIQVIDISHEITINALHSKISDIKEALQYYTALHHKLDYFITREPGLQYAAIPVLPVITPEAFIKNNS